MKNYYRIL